MTPSFYKAVAALERLALYHGDFSIYYSDELKDASFGYGLYCRTGEEGFYFQLHDNECAHDTNAVYFQPTELDLFERLVSIIIEANKWSSDV